ncbi:hypothetical protein L3Q82_017879 [Scortum barcoo]|uniref:Uncharacterized protein n=1 Tax=Scortum barcoo TaxID=214431 RepID=A0ACB8VJU6_9TELE|nr:hypothetical protein L3Q82_017879 [Scortum barcoo]
MHNAPGTPLPDALNNFYACFDDTLSPAPDSPPHQEKSPSGAVHTSSPNRGADGHLQHLSPTGGGPHLPEEDCHDHPHPQNVPTVTGLNDYRPVALTPIVMKCFERLVMAHIKDCIDVTVDPHQYAYRKNRFTEDAISSVVAHTALTHLENKDSYVRLLFVDFTSCVQYNYTADPGPETHNTRTELHPV